MHWWVGCWFGFSESFQDFNESFHRLDNVRAGLSTRRYSCNRWVSTGAGLPTQHGRRYLLLFVLSYDVCFELRLFRGGHCLDKHSELLYSGHESFCFSWLLAIGTWAFSGIVAGLSASVTCAFSMYFVSSAWCVSPLRGTRSTGCHLGLRLICTGACVQPRKKGGRSVSHVVG